MPKKRPMGPQCFTQQCGPGLRGPHALKTRSDGWIHPVTQEEYTKGETVNVWCTEEEHCQACATDHRNASAAAAAAKPVERKPSSDNETQDMGAHSSAGTGCTLRINATHVGSLVNGDTSTGWETTNNFAAVCDSG